MNTGLWESKYEELEDNSGFKELLGLFRLLSLMTLACEGVERERR